MSEDNMQTAYRRRRVQRLKKCIILTLMLFLAVPIVMCVILLLRMHQLENTVEQLAIQLEEIKAEMSVIRQDGLAEGQSNKQQTQTSGHVNPAAGEAGKEFSGLELERLEKDTSSAKVEGENTDSEITASHKVYLTFDDGPSIYTEDILDILDSYGVQATFFVVGKETEWAKDAMRDIVARGHTLGMHSYSHKYSEIYASVDAFAEDFVKLQDYLEEVTGVKSNLYRFPGGSSNTVSSRDMWDFADYLESREVRFFDWNIASGDGGSTLLSVKTLVKNCTEDIPDNSVSVILLHDSAEKRTTVEALPIIIENILAMDDTVILPITDDTEPVQHIHRQAD